MQQTAYIIVSVKKGRIQEVIEKGKVISKVTKVALDIKDAEDYLIYRKYEKTELKTNELSKLISFWQKRNKFGEVISYKAIQEVTNLSYFNQEKEDSQEELNIESWFVPTFAPL